MGRVFVIELEGPVYTCIECHTHIGVASDIISKEIEEVFDIHDNDIIYDFSRLFNTFLAENTFYSALQNIFCVGCANLMGIYNISQVDEGGVQLLTGFGGRDSMDQKEAMMRFRSCA
ncbi:hypothetical protein Bca4012_059717 [Brassica carinata]